MDDFPIDTTLGDALTALSEGALGPGAPETKALAWITHHSTNRTLRAAVADLGLAVAEGPGVAYRLYEAVRDHFKEQDQ